MGQLNDDLLKRGRSAVAPAKTPTLTPIGNRLLLKRVDMPELMRPGSLIELPDSTQEISQFADIVSVGPDVKTEALKPGERVMVQKYAGMELTIAGDVLLIVAEGEIFGVLSGFQDAR